MNWLSYPRMDVRTMKHDPMVLVIGSQRQSIRDVLRANETIFREVLILDNVDYHGSYTHPWNPNNMFSQFHGNFLQKFLSMPSGSAIVLDAALLPREFYPQLQHMIERRHENHHTIMIIFSQTYIIPQWVADATDYVFIHRITCNDQAFRLFGRFFPDLHEFVYGIEQYAKYYEAMVVDNVKKHALWYRPAHI